MVALPLASAPGRPSLALSRTLRGLCWKDDFLRQPDFLCVAILWQFAKMKRPRSFSVRRPLWSKSV
jgi:hypothetical protein